MRAALYLWRATAERVLADRADGGPHRWPADAAGRAEDREPGRAPAVTGARPGCGGHATAPS